MVDEDTSGGNLCTGVKNGTVKKEKFRSQRKEKIGGTQKSLEPSTKVSCLSPQPQEGLGKGAPKRCEELKKNT